MHAALALLVQLAATLLRLFRPHGLRGVVAESVLLRHQLLILNRGRRRAPNLRTSDRIIAGLCTVLMRPARILRSAIVLKPSTLLHLTVLGHAKDSLWSVDMFCCESLAFKTHWVLVVMDQFTRRIIGFGVQRGSIDGQALCRMFGQALGGRSSPRYLSMDNDPLYRFHQWQANLRVLEIEEIKTVPYAPLSHPFVERLIGTIRRECLERTLFWTTADLAVKLAEFQGYFNQHRTHAGLGGRVPDSDRALAPIDFAAYRWQKHCRGLYQTPIAA